MMYLLNIVSSIFIYYSSKICGKILGGWRFALNVEVGLIAKVYKA